jgi:hypothetical protein
MMRTRTILTLLIIAITGLCARADIVTLKDGTTYEGTVIKENGAEVTLEIVISNIKTTKTFPRYKVRSIEYKELEEEVEEESTPSIPPRVSDDEDDADEVVAEEEDEAEDDDSSARRTSRTRSSRAQRTTYIVVPVEGTIGEQTNAYGLRLALDQARRKGVSHIVFTIDSPGGLVYDAVDTLEVLKEYDDQMTFHALVEEGAISAASVYVAAADNIWVRPGSRVGGAVAYTGDASSGTTEVDAKMNSIWAAEIASRAESKGYPGDVFRAMVDPAAEVWIDDEGKVYPSRPSSKGAQQIDNSRTVLTIRAEQMIKIGMAKSFEGEVSSLGEQLDIESWFEVRNVGVTAMTKAAKEREKLEERMDIAVKYYFEKIDEFVQTDPRRFSDYYRGGSFLNNNDNYRIDGESLNRWRDRSRTAMTICDQLLEALTEMARVVKQAEKVGARHLQIPDEDGDYSYDIIKEVREYLWNNRNQIPDEMFTDISPEP